MTGEVLRWEVTPRQGSRRSLLERLVIAAPPLGRRIAGLVARRPAGSPLRRWGLTQFVMVGRGIGSGVEPSVPLYNLWELEDGLLRRQWTFWSEAAMLDFMRRA